MTLLVGCAIPGERWQAAFAWSDEHGGPGLTVRRFRRPFTLPQVTEPFIVYASADSRYKLWINGELVGRGPLKGTLEHYHYEAYDLAPHLRVGENVLAAEVRWFGQHAPTSEVHSARPGFLLQGPEGAGLDTPGAWKVWVDSAVQPDTTPYIANAHAFLGHWEIVRGELIPQGWTQVEFDDSAWGQAIGIGPADVPDFWGTFPRYQQLFPRDVPALIEEPRRFVRTVQNKAEIAHPFGNAPAGWTMPAGQGGEIVLDAGHLTTGYPAFVFEGGENRTVEIVYGECLLQIREHGLHRQPVKAARDDWAFGDVYGYQDTVTLPGGAFAYEPFH